MYISLGSACFMSYQIRRYREIKETLFFDWVVVDFDSVIKVIEKHESIDDILNLGSIKKVGKSDHENKSLVSVDTLSRFYSPHDISIDFSDEEVLQFIDRYKRRLDRIVKAIKGPDKIFFCQSSNNPISKDQKHRFINAVQSINENCKFTLVSVIHEQEENKMLKEDFFLEIKLNGRMTDENLPNYWTFSHIKWWSVFKKIEKHG